MRFVLYRHSIAGRATNFARSLHRRGKVLKGLSPMSAKAARPLISPAPRPKGRVAGTLGKSPICCRHSVLNPRPIFRPLAPEPPRSPMFSPTRPRIIDRFCTGRQQDNIMTKPLSPLYFENPSARMNTSFPQSHSVFHSFSLWKSHFHLEHTAKGLIYHVLYRRTA